jgi:hypothetical protein
MFRVFWKTYLEKKLLRGRLNEKRIAETKSVKNKPHPVSYCCNLGCSWGNPLAVVSFGFLGEVKRRE